MDIFAEDINNVAAADFIPWEKLSGKTAFITGATGLIGRTLIYGLHRANKIHGLNMRVLALVRDRARAEERFRDIISDGMLTLVVGSVENACSRNKREDTG